MGWFSKSKDPDHDPIGDAIAADYMREQNRQTAEARAWLAARGDDGKLTARAVERAMENYREGFTF